MDTQLVTSQRENGSTNTATHQPGQIFGLIPKIIGEIGPIAKDRKNTQQGYAFRGVDDVYQALTALLAKHQVTILPYLDTVSDSVVTTKGGSVMHRVCAVFRYHLYAPDGSFMVSRVPSEAMDSGDKATPKALSMAYKYMAFQVFCIPVDEGLDTEEQTYEIAPQKQPEPPKPLTDAQVKAKFLSLFPDAERADWMRRMLESFEDANKKERHWLMPNETLADLSVDNMRDILANGPWFRDALNKFIDSNKTK